MRDLNLIENGGDQDIINEVLVASDVSSRDINNEANMNLQNSGVVDYSSRDSEKEDAIIDLEKISNG